MTMCRYVENATQMDALLNLLRQQIKVLQQKKHLTKDCSDLKQNLLTENEMLKKQVEELKRQLTEVEVTSGKIVVSLPTSSTGKNKNEKVIQKSVDTKSGEASVPVAKQNNQQSNKKKQQPKKKEEKKAPQPAAGLPVDVSRLDMRVGFIKSAKLHPDADGLYLEEMDCGESEPRQVISGLVKHIKIEDMQQRPCIVLCNLKPAKMRGILSQAMVMCASTPEKVEILTPPSGTKPGDKVTVEGYLGTPDQQLNPKKKVFEGVQPDFQVSGDGYATYKGIQWKVNGQPITAPSMRNCGIK